MLILEREDMKKKVTLEGWISPTTRVEDIIVKSTDDGKIEFSDSNPVYRDKGTEKDWGDEFPPKQIIIEITVGE